MDFSTLWKSALPYADFVAASELKHRGLWEGLYRLARVPEWAVAARNGDRIRLLAIAEDWCGDASNTLPVLARLAELAPGLELRLIKRDEHPELMNRYLTNGSDPSRSSSRSTSSSGRWGTGARARGSCSAG